MAVIRVGPPHIRVQSDPGGRPGSQTTLPKLETRGQRERPPEPHDPGMIEYPVSPEPGWLLPGVDRSSIDPVWADFPRRPGPCRGPHRPLRNPLRGWSGWDGRGIPRAGPEPSSHRRPEVPLA